MKITKKLATKLHSAAYGRNQKIFSHKVTRRDTKKKNGNHFKVLEITISRGFPGCEQKILAKKTKSRWIVIRRDTKKKQKNQCNLRNLWFLLFNRLWVTLVS